MLKKSPDTLARYKSGILACYDCRISSGPLEGHKQQNQNNETNAYGFRDMEFFKLKIMAR
jgi:transposase